MAIICHICKLDEWENAKNNSEFFPSDSEKDGFIKCSFPDQVLQIVQKKFKEHKDRIILMIDLSKLESKVKYSGKGKNQKDPKIMGPINVTAVTDVFHLTPLHEKAPEDEK